MIIKQVGITQTQIKTAALIIERVGLTLKLAIVTVLLNATTTIGQTIAKA